MKLSRNVIGLLALAALVSASGCGYINRIRAKSQLNEVAKNYKEKKYAEAEAHAKRALELDPDNENAPLFIARTIHAQFRKGDITDANISKASEAIAAYKALAQRDPNNDEAFKAVTSLLGQLSTLPPKPDAPEVPAELVAKLSLSPEEQAKLPADEQAKLKDLQAKREAWSKQQDAWKQEQIDWVAQRAANEAVTKERRSEAYAIMASKDWDCSFSRTETGETKKNVDKGGGQIVVQYVKPKDTKSYEDAVRCMTKGLEEAEKAINMNPDNEQAWGVKYNLLLEAAKLSKMDEKPDAAAEYEKQATAAAQRTKELNEKKKATAPPPPATG